MAKKKDKVIKLPINHEEVYEVLFTICFMISSMSMKNENSKKLLKSFAYKLFSRSFNVSEKIYLLYLSDNRELHLIASKNFQLYKSFQMLKAKGVPQWDEAKRKILENKDGK